MTRLPKKLEIHEHPITCPYCGADLVIQSPMEVIFAARRTCPQYNNEMLIDHGKAVRLGAGKKPAKRAQS